MISILHKLAVLFIFIFSTIFTCVPTYAANLQLLKIGDLEVKGKNYKEWWYTEVNPVFTGTGIPNKEVNISVDTRSYKVTANDQGNWAYSSGIQGGDYQITFTQDSEKISFTLHVGQSLPETPVVLSANTSETSGTPDTGSNQIVAICFGVGILLLATYFYIRGDPRANSVFETKVLKD